ncbi:negative transcriptional regulator, PaiB family [Modicisalibacter muralis]|uniref:Negative transcriptional regulator, PaiB family n=1 Tax=Modicisalibacter muralis TaxID=119000 RepID=A0A1G9I4C0_9GAMM|nr:FMN-binding negative transcriptional regulator [Halomonas muralis]SDL20069.1 negative transcriptional regulator, PaiB family [Halomonas muralis]
MYLPKQFRETRASALHALIERHPFATLVTQGSDGLDADHLPFVLDADSGEHGRLRGHVARANPLWKSVSDNADVLVVFQGPQAYITPSWYPAKREHGKVVPTWNYGFVHAHGRIRFIEDADWLYRLVDDLTNAHEAGREAPWHVQDAPADYIAKMSRAIVGVEIEITRLVGKWKASQHKPDDERQGIERGLHEESGLSRRDSGYLAGRDS